MSLIELMVSLVVMALVLSGVAYALIQGISISRDNRNREVAANIAAGEVDKARAIAELSSFFGNYTKSQVIDGEEFSITVNLEPRGVSDSEASPCETGAGFQAAFKLIRVGVTWEAKRGTTDTVWSDSLVSYSPSEAGNAGIAVTVRDAAGDGLAGVTVSATPASGVSATSLTSPEGCAYFEVPAGMYTLRSSGTLEGDTLVTQSGDSQPSKPVTAVANQTVTASFDLDREAALVALLPGVASTHPAVDDVPVTLGNSGLPGTGEKTFAGAGEARTLAPLFPFPSGYAVWAGQCSDARPTGAVSSVVVAPGESESTAVPMAPVAVQVMRAGSPVTGEAVSVTHVPEATPGAMCPSSVTQPTYSLGVTDATGTVRRSLPFGTWSFTASGSSAEALLSSDATGEIVVEVDVP